MTALAFEPQSWLPFAAATLLIGLVYGALAGAVLDKLAATYLMLFLPITDLGIAQNPMFGRRAPSTITREGSWPGSSAAHHSGLRR